MYGINDVSDSVIGNSYLNPIDYDRTQELNREKITSETFTTVLDKLKDTGKSIIENEHRILSYIFSLAGGITSGLGIALLGVTSFNDKVSPIGIKFLIQPNYPPIYDNYSLGALLVAIGFTAVAMGYYLPNEDNKKVKVSVRQEE